MRYNQKLLGRAVHQRIADAVRERLDHHAETDTAFDPDQLAYVVIAALKETP